MTHQTGTIHGLYRLPDGTARTGEIRFTPSAPVVLDGDGVEIISGTLHRFIDADDNGELSVDVPASDDPTLNPAGVTWTVSYHGDLFELPDVVGVFVPAGGTVEMGSVTPPDPAGLSYAAQVGRIEFDELEERVDELEEGGAGGGLTELVQDTVAAALAGTTGVSIGYDDASGTITITAAGDPEAMRDTIGAALLGTGLVSVSVDDAANTITISTTATQNSTDAALRDRSTHTGTQDLTTVTETTTLKILTAAERTKLAGIAPGATANATDAQLRDRGTHTGQQVAATISDLPEAVQDVVGTMLVSGGGLSLSYDDASGQVTVTATGIDAEAVRDTIGAAIVGVDGITVAINDALDTITLGLSGLTVAQIDGLSTTLADLAAADGQTLADAQTYADGVAGDAQLGAQAYTDIQIGDLAPIARTGEYGDLWDLPDLSAKADLVGGVVPTAQIPALALTATVVVASQAAMLALTTAQVQPGDVAVRTDGAGSFILIATDPSVLGNWVRLNAPTDVVTSVAGQTGTVVLAKADVGLNLVDNTPDTGKPVSTAQAAADLAVRTLGFPAHAPATALGRYDPSRNVYNLKESNTRKWRASIGKAIAGTALVHHVFIGDSTWSAYDGSTFQRAYSPPRVYETTLARVAAVPAGGTGLMFVGDGGSGGADPRITFAGSWPNSGEYRFCGTAGGTVTFNSAAVSGFPARTGRYLRVQTLRGYGPMTYSVDGGAVTGTITPPAGAGAYAVVIDCLTDAAHTVVLTTTTNSAVLIGLDFYGASGLLVHNLAFYGGKASGTGHNSWVDLASNVNVNPSRTGALNGAVPAAVFYKLGQNDIPVGTTPIATIIAGIQTIRTQFASSDFFLVAQYRSNNNSVANWEAYVSALYTLADTLDVPLFDLYARSGGYTVANGNGLMGDVDHPNLAAMHDEGRALAMAMMG